MVRKWASFLNQISSFWMDHGKQMGTLLDVVWFYFKGAAGPRQKYGAVYSICSGNNSVRLKKPELCLHQSLGWESNPGPSVREQCYDRYFGCKLMPSS